MLGKLQDLVNIQSRWGMILDPFGTRWKWVVIFMPQQLYPLEQGTWYAFWRKLEFVQKTEFSYPARNQTLIFQPPVSIQ